MTLTTRLILLLLLLSSPTLAMERILSYHSEIDVRVDGSMVVEESIRVRAEGNKIKRGIYRDFPTRYKDKHGNNFKVGFKVLDVTRGDQAEEWHTKRRSNGVRIYAGDADVFLQKGEYTYRFLYQTDRQLGFFEEHDELYWNVTGNGWDFPIDTVTAQVRLPESVSPSSLVMEGYTGPQGSTETDVTTQLAEGAASIRSTRPLGRREGLTLVLQWPKGIVEAPSATERGLRILGDNFGLLVALLATIGSAIYLLLTWNRIGRDPEKGVVFPHYEPPAGYSPASLRYVQKMGYDNETFTAAIINLAVKGYLEIERQKAFLNLGQDYSLHIKPSKQALAPGESQLLSKLFSGGSTLKLENENHSILSRAREAHKLALEKDYRNHYFKTNGLLLLPSAVVSLLLFGLTVVTATLVPMVLPLFGITIVMHIVFAWLLKAPSERGRKLMDKSAGFKLYLEVAEKDELNLRNPPEQTPELFEAYLPYAIALGVEQAWAEQFNSVFARLGYGSSTHYQPDWYHGEFDSSDMGGFSKAVGGSLNSAISSAATAPGSASGGGGGGFSGGGGGGGGGGGW